MINDKIGTLFHQDLPQQEEECVVYCIVLIFEQLLAVRNATESGGNDSSKTFINTGSVRC